MKQERFKTELEEALRGLPLNELEGILLNVRLRKYRYAVLKFLLRIDLWFFPPTLFGLTYTVAWKNFPAHFMKPFAVLSIAFMTATLTLFLIRQPKRVKYHLINKKTWNR